MPSRHVHELTRFCAPTGVASLPVRQRATSCDAMPWPRERDGSWKDPAGQSSQGSSVACPSHSDPSVDLVSGPRPTTPTDLAAGPLVQAQPRMGVWLSQGIPEASAPSQAAKIPPSVSTAMRNAAILGTLSHASAPAGPFLTHCPETRPSSRALPRVSTRPSAATRINDRTGLHTSSHIGWT